MKQSALGARIREARGERKLGLRELARRADVSASFLSEIESGKRSPSAAVLEAIAGALEVDVEKLRDLHEGKIIGDLKGLIESDPTWVPVLGRLAHKAGICKVTPDMLSNWLRRI